MVSFNQNLLPFVNNEVNRYRFKKDYFKFKILKLFQIYTFNKSIGVIYLTNFSKLIVAKKLRKKNKSYKIIPHGIDKFFFKKESIHRNIKEYNFENPFKILYVSSLEFYKNHIILIDAISKLREENYPITLDLVGRGKKYIERSIIDKIKQRDVDNKFLFYRGNKNKVDLREFYHQSNLFVYSSSCETFGQILLESMSSSLPILCSNRTGLDETAKDGAIYFDPFNSEDLISKLKITINNRNLRERISQKAFNYANDFSWSLCSLETFDYLEKIYKTKLK